MNYKKSKIKSYLLIMLFAIAAILPAGCARDRMAIGTVKEIRGQDTAPPPQKVGTAQSLTSAKAGSPIVSVEDMTIPALKEPPPPQDYIVGPNDTIMITVSGHPEYSLGVVGSTGTQRGSRVDGDGNIQILTIGMVHVGGKTLTQIRSFMQAILTKYLKEPSVVVEVVEYKSQPLYLLGQFKNTGIFYMDRPFNVLQGLALGGGYDNASASPRAARVVRDKKVLPVDVYELLMKADQSQNIWLKPGDTIFMPDNKNQMVFVFGAGKGGMMVPLPLSGMNILQAIAVAGFQDTGYHARRVYLIRSLSTTRGQLMVVDVDKIIKGDALPMNVFEGDVIYIPKSAMTTWNEAISELLPTLQTIGAVLTPFVQIKYLKD